MNRTSRQGLRSSMAKAPMVWTSISKPLEDAARALDPLREALGDANGLTRVSEGLPTNLPYTSWMPSGSP